jgi:hypothetical protein
MIIRRSTIIVVRVPQKCTREASQDGNETR